MCLYFRLELENRVAVITTNNAENTENQEDNLALTMMNGNEIPISLKTAYFIYQQAFERIKDIKFIVELLNIAKEYDDTEKLQMKIIWYAYIIL